MAATTKPRHPPLRKMVNNAISTLNEKKGSSLQAIKKFIRCNYTVDIEKITRYIKMYLKTGVASGDLVQSKGRGAAGSFKLGIVTGKEKKSEKSYRSKPKKVANSGKVKVRKNKPVNKKINTKETSRTPVSVVTPFVKTIGLTKK